MTRKHFRRLISGIYLISTGIGISISLIALYSKLGSDYSTPLTWLAVFEFWTLLLPALVTCIIVGLVRLTNKIEPLSEEERQQSFVERLSKTQLFIPLSLLLAVPSAFLASTIPDIWIRGFFRVFSIFIAVHLFITWLLVLLLRRTTRIRKTGWKIVLILLFILSTIAYILVSTIACDLASTDTFYWSESHRRSTSDNREYTESDAQRETPDCPDEEVVVSEETAERLADDAMYIYNQYDWAALGEDYVYSFVMECSEILEYNPNAIYTPCILTSPEEIGEEKYREFAARDSMRFVVKQRLSRFYHQVFHSDYEDFDSEDFDTMLWWLKKALLKRKDAIDYNFFAKRVDMLDLAWRELNALGEKNGRDAFTDIYNYANEEDTYLLWREYGDYITNPYVRYTVNRNSDDQYLLLWAYTFWGRRSNDGTSAMWRILLDQILDVYPNELYPAETVRSQTRNIARAKERATEFIDWYKANYWSFKELKAAKYDDEGKLVKLDRDELGKYVHALKQSNYLTPDLLKSLETTFDQMADSVKTGKIGSGQGEWLRKDPLIDNYSAIAEEMNPITWEVDFIWDTRRQEMQLTSSDGNLNATVKGIDDQWMIDCFCF